MNEMKIAALMLILVGVLGLIYGGLAETRSHQDDIQGPWELSIKEAGRFNLPMLAGMGAIISSVVLLLIDYCGI